ncbi:serine-arginine protein 55 [Lepeophtheirus salmonis]|uniref:Serine-arginine protein 55 n=1 Tax=Lepeophtheirus salmonis TaxID=72036 RepID=C1BTI8_LEPSM|nr:serine-arginine protein 55-like [Lepeophtheirus salmonis]ACO12341.1 Serine-arginine protein 55 [Lepeophtheirus salmonis]ADD24429.1 Serine-arginine protein 55 [Lepeophtheirus salmonis]ADD38445.1 Serine-arginine protein 55 [Lepeophtheirus salmonis]
MPNGSRVYVGNLPENVRERDVEKLFKEYGRIREVVIKSGYGFVEFDDPRDADDVVNDMDGKEFQGGRVRVEMARDPRERRGRDRDRGYERRGGGGGGYDRRDTRGDRGRRGNPPGPRTNYRITVQNLSSRTSWQDLKDYFRAAGEITYTNAHTPRQGEGVVEFASSRGLDYAIDHQDELELDGRRLKVFEEHRRSRSGSYGRNRSRSRSRSRSNSRSRSRSRSRSPSDKRRSRSRSKSRSRSNSRFRDEN